MIKPGEKNSPNDLFSKVSGTTDEIGFTVFVFYQQLPHKMTINGKITNT